VIVGHSERRADCGETDGHRVRQGGGCVAGGPAADRLHRRDPGGARGRQDAGRARDPAQGQRCRPDRPPPGWSWPTKPVWAIGTGKDADHGPKSPQAHAHIRQVLGGADGRGGRGVRLLYGGSVKDSNAAELLAAGDVDGAPGRRRQPQGGRFFWLSPRAVQKRLEAARLATIPTQHWTKWTRYEAFCTIGGWCC